VLVLYRFAAIDFNSFDASKRALYFLLYADTSAILFLGFIAKSFSRSADASS
jgi:hypothetical protein